MPQAQTRDAAPQTRMLPPQLREVRLLPETYNAEASTLDVTWGQGVRVRRYDWYADRYYDEELAMDGADLSRFQSGNAAVLKDHDTWSIDSQIGVIESARIENGEGTATLRLSQRADVAGLVQDILAKIIRNLSVGYIVQRYEITEAPGEVPVYRAVEWTPLELSFVTVPADPSAASRSQPPSTRSGSPCVFTRAQAHTTEDLAMPNTAPVAAATRAADDAANTTVAAPVAQPTPPSDDAAALNARAAEIVEIATRHGMSDRAAEWLRTGHSVDKVRGLILDELATRDADAGGNFNRVQAGVDEADKFRGAATDALLARAMVTNPTTKARYAVDGSNPARGLTLVELARACLTRIGVRTEGMSKLELVGRAFTQGTSDFPVLLESAMHKTLQGAYALAPITWNLWANKGTVSDFRAHNRYRTGSLGNLLAVNELAEFQNKTIPDGEKASITAGTKGYVINLSRQAIINDDLGAFIGLAADLGRAAARTVEADAYAALAANPTLPDGLTLFHATHKNNATASAPTVSTIDDARVLLAGQTGVGGTDYLNLRPSVFLSGLAYGSAARVANASEFDPDATNKLQRPNVVRGLFQQVVDSPYVAANKWYLFAAPADAPVFEVAFLDGNDTPFLDQEEGFTVDGTRYKVRLDYGVAAIDYRGAVYNGAL